MRERELYRPHVGHFAWPTVALLGLVVLLWVGAWIGVLTDALGLALGGALTTLAAYLAFTVMHEASHGNVHGGREQRWIGEVAGWIASVTLFAPYPAFRVLHLRHHSYTNDPDKDPDYFVAGSPWAAPFKCLFTIPLYYAEFLFGRSAKSAPGRRERKWVVLGLVAYAIVAVALSAAGLWREVLGLWLGPAVLAAAVLAFFFDYVPHHPHDTQERFRDTRIVDSRPLDVLLLGQNLHLVHHLWPRVPFYRYRAVFEAAREELAAKGAEVRPTRRPAPFAPGPSGSADL
jgi:beta-carotene hydroxylase